MENEEMFKEELKYIDESILISNPLFKYFVYTTVAQQSGTNEVFCYAFSSSPKLDRETIFNEIKVAINNAGQ